MIPVQFLEQPTLILYPPMACAEFLPEIAAVGATPSLAVLPELGFLSDACKSPTLSNRWQHPI